MNFVIVYKKFCFRNLSVDVVVLFFCLTCFFSTEYAYTHTRREFLISFLLLLLYVFVVVVSVRLFIYRILSVVIFRFALVTCIQLRWDGTAGVKRTKFLSCEKKKCIIQSKPNHLFTFFYFNKNKQTHTNSHTHCLLCNSFVFINAIERNADICFRV